MAGYTIRNLKEVEDAAQRFGLGDGLEARFASRALEFEQAGRGYERLAPNFRVPFGHRHAQQEEVYVVVSGSGRVKLDDEIREVQQWDAVRVPGDTVRCFEAGPDGLELIAFGAPRTAQRDGELLPGWWTD